MKQVFEHPFEKRPCLLAVFFFLFFLGKTQGQIDSLRQLVGTTEGVEKVDALLELSFLLATEPPTAAEGRELAIEGLRLAGALPDSYRHKQRRRFGMNEIISVASIRLGDFDRAQVAASASLAIARNMPDTLGDRLEGRSFLQLAEIYHWQGQHQKQVAMLRNAVRIFDETVQRDDWAVALNNLGSAYSKMERYDSALLCFQACDPVFESWGGGMDLPNKATIALTMQEMGKWERAGQLLDTVLALAPEKDFPDIAYAWVAKGKNLLHFRQYREALRAFRQARPYLAGLKEPDARAVYFKEFAAAFEGAGQLDSALFYLKKYKAVEDSLQSELFGKDLADAQVRLETDEKLARLEAEMLQRQQKGNLKLVLSGAVLLALAGGGFWFFYQKKKREMAAAARTITVNLEGAPGGSSALTDPFLESFLGIVKERVADEKLSVEGIANRLKMSRVQLFKKVKSATGASPSAIIRQYRLEAGKKLLLEKTLTISEVAYRVGFSSPNSFSRAFKEKFGQPPSAFLSENDTEG